jgi:2-dehydro-3-deoxy-D-gluconate 5-dehydrogenase
MPDLTMFDLTGRVAAVTGGNGGIGKGIALALAGAGAAVAIIGRNEQKNQAAVAELLARQANAIAIRLDVNERTALPGALDILVNNAGIAIAGGALRLAAEDWDRVLETNLNSCFFLSQIAARSMVARKMGKIINIASEYSRFGNQVAPSYAASKGALIQLTKSMAIELATHNVQVNAIVPGWIDSDMTAPIKSRPFYNEILMRTPAGRFGTPAECGGAAVFLASRASDFVTGATIFVDGGYAIR